MGELDEGRRRKRRLTGTFDLLLSQVCISVFLTGAGAPSATQPGKDGNIRCSPEARVFALQVVDQVVGDKTK